MFKRITLLVLLSLVSAFSVLADEKSDVTAIKKVFAEVLPGAKADSIKLSALGGLYEVVYGAQVLLGKARPKDCKLFGKACTPSNAVGPCMVSSEGACAAWYKYRTP